MQDRYPPPKAKIDYHYIPDTKQQIAQTFPVSYRERLANAFRQRIAMLRKGR